MTGTASQQEASAYGAAAAEQAAQYVKARVGAEWRPPVVGIVLGSGLGGLADRIENALRIPFSHVPGFPVVTVAGHAGQLLVGTLGGVPVVALAGRFHLYEGHDAALAAFPVRVLHALGAPVYLASNAAGGVRRTFAPGDLMVIADHMNLMFRNPLIGSAEPGDERFPDMSDPYDRDLRALLHTAGSAAHVPLQEGVYCGLLGPTYETPAEVRMLERLGVDAVGMSTVPEVIVARALGMRVAAVSCITNAAAGLSPVPLNHEEVMEAGRAVASRFEALVTEFVRRLPAVSA
ncbi:MAG: purine-nucleoside phosphorylase [Gemmatimonas sp.]|jgi:purine-nucleoside phosphorylase|nr:purine-nucleoside phosphorylase [Gemmatimonas sp.]